MFDWNDLRYFLPVARHGSTLAAARALKMNQSTVQRRLTELERRIGRPLVRRQPTGYRLTELGQEMLSYAERVEQAVLSFEQQLEESKRNLAGVVRVACPEPIVYRITQSALLERFQARYPDLRIEFVMSDKYADLSKGEADVALRSGDTNDGELVGRKIADSIWAVYAGRRYIEQHGKPERVEDLERHLVVGFDDTMANHRAAKWLGKVAPTAKVVARNNSVLGLVYAVKSGIGVGASNRARRCGGGSRTRPRTDSRALAHLARSRTPRRATHAPRVGLFDFITEEIEALRPILTG
jgi:DNA-binding transcriptional LysR family regulator